MYSPEQRVRDLILGKLAQIEIDHDVEIVFAVESGSRAWGFASPDSDYDVRFVYRQKTTEYLRLLKKPDTLGRSVKGALYDVTGWDISKALSLGLRSNATLLEWLQSPIRYRWSAEAEAAELCMKRTAERKGLVYNYYNLARTAWEEDINPHQQVRCKKYLYALRAALTLRHMRLFPAIPPMNIQQLMEGADLSANVSAAIEGLIRIKVASEESQSVERVPAVDSVIKLEIDNAAATKPEKSQLVSDEKLLAMAERTFFKIIGVNPHELAAGKLPG